MSLNPWKVTQQAPLWTITLTTDSGADNITGLTAGSFSIIFKQTSNGPGQGQETTGTGTFAIVTANPAVITYQVSVADVTNAGTYLVTVWATFSNGPKPWELGEVDLLPK